MLILNLFFSCDSEMPAQKKRRYCRVIGNVEETAGKGDVPGWNLDPNPKLKTDDRGYLKFISPRNHPRIVQSSMNLVQGWRANADIQILLYDSSPMEPDPSDVAKVTDYVVGYIAKGNESIVQEKRNMNVIIQNSDIVTGDSQDFRKVARQLLNSTVKDRVISKQEAMCTLRGLSLCLCSESIDTVSISGYRKISTNKTAKSSILNMYANRKNDDELTLHQFFKKIKKWDKR